ncbi:hypothetical protein [Saccharopolyspora gregorii]|uniref:Uncharacterized protein n=1 Tax=Saccharopolyspora gregorii TaxID=33914 RepID=A0ABP6S358_9PSEU
MGLGPQGGRSLVMGGEPVAQRTTTTQQDTAAGTSFARDVPLSEDLESAAPLLQQARRGRTRELLDTAAVLLSRAGEIPARCRRSCGKRSRRASRRGSTAARGRVRPALRAREGLAGGVRAGNPGRPPRLRHPADVPLWDGPRRGDGAEDTGTSTPEGAKDAEDGTRGTGDANSDGRRSDDSDDARGPTAVRTRTAPRMRGRREEEGLRRGREGRRGGGQKDPEAGPGDREALPDYVRSGQSLARSCSNRRTRRANLPEDTRTLEFTGPDVVAHLNSLVPGGKGKWEDTGVVQRRIDNAVHSLVGTGDTFTVRKGGKFLRAAGPGRPAVRRDEVGEALRGVHQGEREDREVDLAHQRRGADKSFSPQLATTSVPGLYVYVNPTLPGGFSETHLSEQSQKHGSEHKNAIKELHDVDVPMKFEFSLRDSKDRVVTRPAWSATSPAPSRTAAGAAHHLGDGGRGAAGADRALQRPVHRQRARRRPRPTRTWTATTSR